MNPKVVLLVGAIAALLTANCSGTKSRTTSAANPPAATTSAAAAVTDVSDPNFGLSSGKGIGAGFQLPGPIQNLCAVVNTTFFSGPLTSDNQGGSDGTYCGGSGGVRATYIPELSDEERAARVHERLSEASFQAQAVPGLGDTAIQDGAELIVWAGNLELIVPGTAESGDQSVARQMLQALEAGRCPVIDFQPPARPKALSC